MSPAEIIWRLGQQRILRHERAWAATGEALPTLTVAQKSAWHQAFIQAEAGRFFFAPTDATLIRQHWRERFSAETQATLDQAEQLLRSSITLFHRPLPLDNPIQWQRDPLTRRDWPHRFHADINTRDGFSVGGVKWVWELNRHHHLTTLGKAYFLTGDERFAQAAAAHLDGWLAANPPLVGVNWTSALELAVRLINWLWLLHFLRESPVLTADRFGRVMQSVQAQAAYIERHLSAFSSANNHLIGELAGLAVVGLGCPWLPAATRWRALGLSRLEEELARQIRVDGVSAEQATAYLAFVLDFNLLTWQLARLNGHTPPPIWEQRLAAAADYIRHSLDEAGNLPALGDDDEGRVVRLDDRPAANNYQSLLAAAAALLRRPELKAAAGRWDEKSAWLLGESGRQAFDSLPESAAPPESRLFAQGGVAAMRAPGRTLLADVGPLGYLSLAAHGHADALSLWVSIGGRPMLIDPDTYGYQEGGEWRRFLRSSAAHNTVVVDGLDQSEMAGDFLWGRRAEVRLVHWATRPAYDCLIAEHDGYARLGVTHRRHWLFDKADWLLIVDALQGRRAHRVEQWWHFPADCEIRLESDIIYAQLGGMRLTMLFSGPVTACLTTRQGELSPAQGWLSPHYGAIVAAPAVSFGGMVELPGVLSVLLCLGAWPERAVLLEHQAICAEMLKTTCEEVAI